MKPNMKKKFDFSAEMNDTESIKITPKNEYLEEEKRLLDVNAKELANLNDNVHYMITNLVNLIYNYLTICKWVVYKFCFWNKKQIRNKNGFLGKSSFFCLHYFSFLSLACNQSTNPSYYYAFSSWFNICFFIYPGIRSEKRKVLFSMIDINMCKVKNNHPSNQIFVYF